MTFQIASATPTMWGTVDFEDVDETQNSSA